MSLEGMLFLLFLASWLLLRLTITLGFWSLERPHFYLNVMDDVTAVCSVSDFKRAEETDRFVVHLPSGSSKVFVPETMLFDGLKGEAPKSCAYFGSWPLPAKRLGLITTHEPQLFVPFVNETVASFDQQDRILLLGDDGLSRSSLEAFCSRKREENFRHSRVLRFGRWFGRSKWMIARLELAASLMSIVFAVINVASWYQESGRREEALVYNVYASAPDGTLREHAVTGFSRQGELPFQDYATGPEFRYRIFRGTVVSIVPLGGGTDWVCLEYGTSTPDKERRCGMADSDLPLAVTSPAYFRQARLDTYYRHGFAEAEITAGWFITEREALALQEKGYPIKQ